MSAHKDVFSLKEYRKAWGKGGVLSAIIQTEHGAAFIKGS